MTAAESLPTLCLVSALVEAVSTCLLFLMLSCRRCFRLLSTVVFVCLAHILTGGTARGMKIMSEIQHRAMRDDAQIMSFLTLTCGRCCSGGVDGCWQGCLVAWQWQIVGGLWARGEVCKGL